MLVENREGLEADLTSDFSEPRAGGQELLFRSVETGAEQRVSGRSVIVQPKELEETRGAKTRS